MIKLNHIVFITIASIFFACSPNDDLLPPTNPFDPDNPDYELPQASITGTVFYGEVIDTTSATLTWIGNATAYEYSYRLNENAWSDWTRDTSVTLRYLDEGNYQFEIKARTNQTVPVEGDANAFHFSVDAVKGPAMMVCPRYKEVSVGEEFEIEILAEEVENVMGAEIELTFDPSIIQVKDVIYGAFMFDGGDLSVTFKEIDNENGKAGVVLVRTSNTSPTVSGTGTLAVLEIKGLTSGITQIGFTDNCTFRDENNNVVEIEEKTVGILKIE
ncbi:MAG: hypothetical protein KAU06_09705 [Candidatus Marinimicrobia bacterium]|nr:hypothetical protein [Candidatus Neomarinimicrobiota bacterium]